ncbi:MAG: hypothetical protein DRI54_00555 [Bacteroidetes bacterium]|nr:MAG: hypothetical protein DRI54_00555 [Bacteroidota bacterium]
MFDALYIYFKEEKAESLWFILIGIFSILFSIWLFIKFKEGFYRGLIIPVVLISLIQLTVGTTVYFRTDKQIEIIVDQLKVDKQSAQTEELVRMEMVMKNFKIYKWIEFLFILSGVLLLIFITDKPFWSGIGAGLLIEGTFMIVLDVIAEMRGAKYLEWLQQF